MITAPDWKQPQWSLAMTNTAKNPNRAEFHANYCYTCKTWKLLTNTIRSNKT